MTDCTKAGHAGAPTSADSRGTATVIIMRHDDPLGDRVSFRAGASLQLSRARRPPIAFGNEAGGATATPPLGGAGRITHSAGRLCGPRGAQGQLSKLGPSAGGAHCERAPEGRRRRLVVVVVARVFGLISARGKWPASSSAALVAASHY
jgi:hypothetical protein